MDEDAYRDELLSILRRHSEHAGATLRSLAAALPEKARSMHIVVHVGQEADGLFDVMAHLDGPDLFVLNRAIQDYRRLFETRYVESGGVHPPVPTFDPFEQPFEVNDIIVDVATDWLRGLWSDLRDTRFDLPVTVFGEDGYGAKGPVVLSR